MIVVAWFI